MGTMKNCELPDELLYDVEHDLWGRVEGEEVWIGLTDVGQTLAGKIRFVSYLRKPGDTTAASKALALLESAKWLAPIRAAVPGTLLAVNEELLAHPLLVNLDSYGSGWVVRFRPAVPLPWLTGEAAQEAYAQRLKRTFRSVAGVNEDFWCVHCNDWDEA